MTVEKNDKVLSIPDAGGKGISVAVSEIKKNDKVILIPDKTGTTVIRTAPIEVGDAVVLLPDKSGKRIAVRADAVSGTSTSEDVDPCESLVVVPDPLNPARLLIQWIPGDNNDEVEYDISLDGYLTTPRTGDIYRTWGVSTTEATEPQLRYFVWHFVTIWGKRRGRYSKVALKASIKMPLDAIFPHLRLYTTVTINYFPTGGTNWAGWSSFSVDPADPLGWGLWSYTTNSPMPIQWLVYEMAPSDWMNCVQRHTASGNGLSFPPNEGQTIYSGPWNNSNGVRYVDISSLLTETPTNIFTQFTNPGCGTVDALGRMTHFNAKWLVFPAGTVIQPPGYRSFYVGVGIPAPVDFPTAVAGVAYRPQGIPGYENTIYFCDGVSGVAYIALRQADPDRGILEVRAYVPGEYSHISGQWIGKTSDMQLYFGNILLCDNIRWQTGTTYHGYLPVSLLML